MATQEVDRLLSLPEVLELTGVGKTKVYMDVKSGVFPAPVKVGVKSVRWRASELAEWMAALVKVA